MNQRRDTRRDHQDKIYMDEFNKRIDSGIEKLKAEASAKGMSIYEYQEEKRKNGEGDLGDNIEDIMISEYRRGLMVGIVLGVLLILFIMLVFFRL